MPLMKKDSAFGYSHGFNIVEVGEQIREDITVVMSAPKCPGTEVREEYKRGFGVPTLIAVHPSIDPRGEGMAIAKAWAAATGGDRAGVSYVTTNLLLMVKIQHTQANLSNTVGKPLQKH